MIQELTLAQAKQAPACFLYVWATEKFINAIPRKYADVIRVKAANEKKLMYLSAEKERMSYEDYANEVRGAFKETYDMTPERALLVLAQGGQVAGKDWASGVYGIGASLVNTFAGHEDVTVREDDGHILKAGADITDTTKTVYNTIKNTVVPYQLFGKADDITYMSQYNKKNGKYYAQTYSTSDSMYSAVTGKETLGSQTADIWGTITLWVEKVINWILAFFGSDVTIDTSKTMNADNTLPNQTADGFVQESGLGGSIGIALLLAAGLGLIATGGWKVSKSKKNIAK